MRRIDRHKHMFWFVVLGLIHSICVSSYGQVTRLPTPNDEPLFPTLTSETTFADPDGLSLLSPTDIPAVPKESGVIETGTTEFGTFDVGIASSVMLTPSATTSPTPMAVSPTLFDPACAPDCDSLCGPKCFRTWARMDLLVWAMEGYATPALLTTSPPGTSQATAGVLGNPATTTLLGNRKFGEDMTLGGRVRIGHWLDADRTIGIQSDFFVVDGGSESEFFSSTGGEILARPFLNTDPTVNAADSQIFALPGLASGSLQVNSSSDILSTGLGIRRNLFCCRQPDARLARRVDLLLGYRYFRAHEEFEAEEILQPIGGLFVAGTQYQLNDRIRTENDFHGFEFGLNQTFQYNRWFWDLSSVFAIGQVRRAVQLDGSTTIDVPGFVNGTFPGAFHVGAENVGRFVNYDFAFIPQLRANAAYCLGDNWRLGVGYNFMYLSSMFRPDSYLRTTLDGSRLGRTPAAGLATVRPATPRRDMFLHGVNVFLTYNF